MKYPLRKLTKITSLGLLKFTAVLILAFSYFISNVNAETNVVGKWKDKFGTIEIVEFFEPYYRFVINNLNTSIKTPKIREYTRINGTYIPIKNVVKDKNDAVIVYADSKPDYYFIVSGDGALEVYNKKGLWKIMDKVK